MTASRRPGLSLAASATLLAGAATLGGCIGTTYGTGEYPEAAIFREMTGGMARKVTGKGRETPIDYSARAPLVEPPAPQLPDPVQTASVSHPDWPVDPDKTAGQEVSDEITPEYRARLEPLKALSRAQPKRKDPGFRDSGLESPAEFHANRNARTEFKSDVEQASGVGVGPGKRKYLTQPPDEYGMPAESAPTEFENIKRKRKGFLFGLFSRES